MVLGTTRLELGLQEWVKFEQIQVSRLFRPVHILGSADNTESLQQLFVFAAILAKWP